MMKMLRLLLVPAGLVCAMEAGDGFSVATFGMGLTLPLTFKLAANTQLDAGVNLGLSRGADDAPGFAGLSRRF